MIESVQMLEDDSLKVVMASGCFHIFNPEAAKIFLAEVNSVITSLLQQVQQPQILAVPPGTQLRPR